MKLIPQFPPELPQARINGLSLMVPLETEVICRHREMVTGVQFNAEQKLVTIGMDARRAPWRKRLGLPKGTEIHWADVRPVVIRELSVLPWRIQYRLIYGDPWYKDEHGERKYVGLQQHMPEVDLEREASTVTLRAGVLLCVLAGIGLRCVSWLMELLFHCEVSKSALDRWVRECAAQLPDGEEMAKRLHADRPITECHLDELFAKGQKPKRYTVVLKDEHGRIFAVRALAERSAGQVAQFLREVKGWGLDFKAFYVDGCEAYREAIKEVFPTAVIQYDYFHIIKNAWKKLRQALLGRRRELKEHAEQAGEPAPGYTQYMRGLVQRIWDNRGLFFRKEKKLSEEDKRTLEALCEAECLLGKVRRFALGVWSIFEESKTEDEAQQKLAELKARPEARIPGAFQQVVKFLEERFYDMVAYLRRPGEVRRNSLAESGMRCLRRLEQGHDGFRGAEGLDRYLRIYQAIRYCGWTVHRESHGLGLEPLEPRTGLFEPGVPEPAG